MGLAQIKMPQLGESVTEGTVDHWLKNEGDFVKRDEPLVEVVTDKVNAEIPSPFEGKLVKITAGAGEVVSVGAVIGQIEVAGAGAAAEPQGAGRFKGSGEEAVRLSWTRKPIADHVVPCPATRPRGWTRQEAIVPTRLRNREAEKGASRSRHNTALTYLPFVAQVLFGG